MTERDTLAVRTALGLWLVLALAACGDNPPSHGGLAVHAEAARQPAELQVGDVTIRASLAPTASLNATIARRYGVQPARNVQLLLVGVRRGPLHDETSLAARITARVRDLRGVWQDVPLREVRSEGFIDHVGTARVSPPDTLAFEITVRHDDGNAPAVLRFSRDILLP